MKKYNVTLVNLVANDEGKRKRTTRKKRVEGMIAMSYHSLHCRDTVHTKNPSYISQVRPLCLPQHTPRAIFYRSYQNHQAMVIDMRISKERIETERTNQNKKKNKPHSILEHYILSTKHHYDQTVASRRFAQEATS